jgi:hypothetical protein
VGEQLSKSGLFLIADTPGEFRDDIVEEIGIWNKVITDAKIPTQ